MQVIKRNGDVVDWDLGKIVLAIMKANDEVGSPLTDGNIGDILEAIEDEFRLTDGPVTVEEIQDVVEEKICEKNFEVGKAYILYRYRRQLERSNKLDSAVLDIVNFENEEVKQENSNKNPEIIPTQRDYIAGEVSKKITMGELLPKRISDAHNKGIIHFHDADYFIHHSHNCDLVNLDDMLQNGTVISGVKIDKPHMFSTACNIATQIIAQVASCQYGGQSISLYHLAKFVQETRRYFRELLADYEPCMSKTDFTDLIEELTYADVDRGIQTLQYQIITLMTTNGQAPFITVFMDLNEAPYKSSLQADLAMCIESVLNQRIKGVRNKAGQWVGPAFPKLIYALDDCNAIPGSDYYWLTELAAECTAKRMVPDYISNKVMRELKGGDTYTCMGCRSFLTPDRFTDAGVGNIAKAKNYVEGEHRYYGRFNQGVVTINLVDAALSAEGDMSKFWDILWERCELCHEALQYRHKRLLGTKSDIAPILWQHGALARLESGEEITPLLFNGYSTISLGYAGLWECVYALSGKKLTEEGGQALGIAIMEQLNQFTKKWKAAENIDYSLYGTPIESTTYKFAKCLKDRFGVIEGVTDKDYITNSYHIHVTEPVDAFTKLDIEATFQALSPGGAISYVEVPNMSNNIEGVLAVIQHIYNTIMYAELNTKFDTCHLCGFEGEFEMKDIDGKRTWVCPQCGNHDPHNYTVVRRVCGYLSSNEMNQGRLHEIKERVLHL